MVCRFALALAAAALWVAGCSGSSRASYGPAVSREMRSAGAGTVTVAARAATTTTTERLPAYRIDPRKVFVAGISSGGFFGVQMHVAHSATFKGAAIYAGGVYYCATGNVGLALLNCGGETLPTGQASYHSTLAQSERYLDEQSAAGTIDRSANLAGQPVYLWSGTQDAVVNPLEMADLRSEYAHYGARIKFDNAFPANHGWESPDGELACGTAASPYMISCNQGARPYDSVKTWMTQFFGRLEPRNDGPARGTLRRFDQTEFGATASNSLDTNGYVFVPAACARGASCGLVLALHGCLQNQALIGQKFVTESGIDAWADGNRVVVLYPYAVQAQGPNPYNPQGCWDWWGYDDPNYALRGGTQLSIVYRMVEHVMGKR
jgi:poly(3-hydroxybutyrate) depolymerase